MSFYIENETETEPFPDYERTLEKVVKEALLHEHCPYGAEVNLIITDNESIRALNRENRNLDKPTDVLSFPMNEYRHPGDFTEIDSSPYAFNPETDELLLGDIVISGEMAASQAEEYGHSIEREMAFLTAHSMLHLMGYDHEGDEERLVMEKKQEEILQSLGLIR